MGDLLKNRWVVLLKNTEVLRVKSLGGIAKKRRGIKSKIIG
jgi:hypothetical protein